MSNTILDLNTKVKYFIFNFLSHFSYLNDKSQLDELYKNEETGSSFLSYYSGRGHLASCLFRFVEIIRDYDKCFRNKCKRKNFDSFVEEYYGEGSTKKEELKVNKFF